MLAEDGQNSKLCDKRENGVWSLPDGFIMVVALGENTRCQTE